MEVEKSIEKSTSSDAEESNESATETTSVGGSGNNFAINCAEWRRFVRREAKNVKQAEDGSGAERRNGAATSEVRNAQLDMLRREAHGGIIQRDGLTDGHTGTEVPR